MGFVLMLPCDFWWCPTIFSRVCVCVCVPPLIQDDDDMGVAQAGGGRPTYSAPADLLNNVPSNEQVRRPSPSFCLDSLLP